jgi:hypothetical protein
MIEDKHIDYIKTKVINIVKKNDPEKSVQLISKIKLPDHTLIGLEKAAKIYIRFSDYSVVYNKKIHIYNGSLWINKVNKNISKAIKIKNK